jgi:hypothetical protein
MQSLTQARHHKLQQAVSFLPVVVQLLLFQPLIVVNVVLLARSATLLQTKNASFAGCCLFDSELIARLFA